MAKCVPQIRYLLSVNKILSCRKYNWLTQYIIKGRLFNNSNEENIMTCVVNKKFTVSKSNIIELQEKQLVYQLTDNIIVFSSQNST